MEEGATSRDFGNSKQAIRCFFYVKFQSAKEAVKPIEIEDK